MKKAYTAPQLLDYGQLTDLVLGTGLVCGPSSDMSGQDTSSLYRSSAATGS